jgi:RhoGAP domain
VPLFNVKLKLPVCVFGQKEKKKKPRKKNQVKLKNDFLWAFCCEPKKKKKLRKNQTKKTNCDFHEGAWASEMKETANTAEMWREKFSKQQGAEQLAQSLSHVVEFNRMLSTGMNSLSKFVEMVLVTQQRKFVAEDVKEAKRVKKKYDRAKQEVIGTENEVESAQRILKKTLNAASGGTGGVTSPSAYSRQSEGPMREKVAEAEQRLAVARVTYSEIADEALSVLTHTTETADCESVEMMYGYLETHRSFFAKGHEWLADIDDDFNELKEYVQRQKESLAKTAPSGAGSYGAQRVFGEPLEALVARDPGSPVPAPLRQIIEAIYAHLDVDGIFRISAQQAVLEKPRVAIDRGDDIDFSQLDPHVLASLLKKFLREMPDPLLTSKLYGHWVQAAVLRDQDQLALLRSAMANLPAANRELLGAIAKLARAVVDHESANRMGKKNVAIIFAPCLIWSTADDPTLVARDMNDCQTVVDILLRRFDDIVRTQHLTSPRSPRQVRLSVALAPHSFAAQQQKHEGRSRASSFGSPNGKLTAGKQPSPSASPASPSPYRALPTTTQGGVDPYRGRASTVAVAGRGGSGAGLISGTPPRGHQRGRGGGPARGQPPRGRGRGHRTAPIPPAKRGALPPSPSPSNNTQHRALPSSPYR